MQDQLGVLSDTGNIFLSNLHRVFQNKREPSFEDEDTTDYFLGKRPTGKTNESRLDLGAIVREVPDLIVLNGEARHRDGFAWRAYRDRRQRRWPRYQEHKLPKAAPLWVRNALRFMKGSLDGGVGRAWFNPAVTPGTSACGCRIRSPSAR